MPDLTSVRVKVTSRRSRNWEGQCMFVYLETTLFGRTEQTPGIEHQTPGYNPPILPSACPQKQQLPAHTLDPSAGTEMCMPPATTAARGPSPQCGSSGSSREPRASFGAEGAFKTVP